MSNKFGSMFDDDEDLGSIPQAPADDQEQPRAKDAGLLNDEAAALIEEKAKAAADQGKRAAKAGLTAATRAAMAMKERGVELKKRVKATNKPRVSPLVLGLGAIVIAMGGVIGWLVLSRDQDSREPIQPVTPVLSAPDALNNTDALPGAVVAPPAEDPATDELTERDGEAPQAPSKTGAPGNRHVPPSEPASEEKPEQAKAPEATPAPEAISQAVAAPKANPAASQENSAAPVRAINPVRTRPNPAPKQVKPAPDKPIGEREQQQIDQIRSMFGDQP